MFVVRGGGLRRTLERFLLSVWWWVEEAEGREDVRRERRERLCASVRERRSVARKAAVMSGDGGSPNIKNLINAPMRITTESWPRRRPWVKERLEELDLLFRDGEGSYEDSTLGASRVDIFESYILEADTCNCDVLEI